MRLRQLFVDVCWYNHETACRLWRHPWPATDMGSRMRMLGCRQYTHWNRGVRVSKSYRTVWYVGPLRDAPQLPPQIAVNDLKLAYEHMVECQSQRHAAHDWAPGGAKYRKLAKRTQVGKFSSGVSMSDDCESEGARSNDTVDAIDILDMVVEYGLDGKFESLSYECTCSDGSVEVFDRSDLMDDGPMQRMVLKWEKRSPPPWDTICCYCDGEKCEECVCEECGAPNRQIEGVNFGCERHPVI